MAAKHIASDEFIVWAQSLSGMLTKIRGQYGGMANMVEHIDWDENKTAYALSLVQRLHEHLTIVQTELSNHVAEKLGEDQR